MRSSSARAPDMHEVVRTSGRSMAPLVRDRSFVTCRAAAPDSVAPGDIIVFRRDGRLIAHRLIGRRNGVDGIELREKGDNSLRASWVPGGALIGRAIELRFDGARRSLDVSNADPRLRCLTLWSRFEADMLDFYLGLTARRSAFRLLRWLLAPAAFAAVLLRRMLYPILLRVYPQRAAEDSASAMRVVLECFRSIFRPGPSTERSRESGPTVQEGRANGLDGGRLAAAAAAAEDWDQVLDLAGSLGILPSLIRLSGENAGGSAVPARTLEQVRKRAYRAAFNHNNALKALSAAGQALAKVSPWAVLKGPYLYEALYQGLFPREYYDMDILVPRQRVGSAMLALQSAGYSPAGGRLGRALLQTGHFHVALDPAAGNWPRIELHWSLVDRANLFRIPDGECFGRLKTFRTADIEFSVLAPEDQFIYLCLHAAKHGVVNYIGLRRDCPAEWFCRPGAGNRLTWFADIGLFLMKNTTSLDWPVLRERAARWNVTDEVAECLRVLQKIAPESPAGDALERMGLGAGLISAASAMAPAAEPPRLDWAMRTNRVLLIRPIRLLLSGRLFFPSPRRLRGYYGFRSAWLLPWHYLRHPFHVAARLVNLAPPPSTWQ